MHARQFGNKIHLCRPFQMTCWKIKSNETSFFHSPGAGPEKLASAGRGFGRRNVVQAWARQCYGSVSSSFETKASPTIRSSGSSLGTLVSMYLKCAIVSVLLSSARIQTKQSNRVGRYKHHYRAENLLERNVGSFLDQQPDHKTL